MGWFEEWGRLVLLQLLIYVGVCGSIQVFVLLGTRLKLGSLIDERPFMARQIPKEISWGMLTCVIYGTAMLGLTQLIVPETEASWSEVVFKIVAFLLFYDFCIYFVHRLLHQPGWKQFHHLHHCSVRVTPWSTLSLHPVEAISNQLPYFLFLAVVPVSESLLWVFYIWLMVGTGLGHSNYNPFSALSERNFFRRYCRVHQLHHRYGKYNFGFMGNHWDIIFGTNCRDFSDTQSG